MTTQTAVHIDVEPGCPIPLATLGRLYGGDERALADTLQTLTEPQRARLALFCNNRQHLRSLACGLLPPARSRSSCRSLGPLEVSFSSSPAATSIGWSVERAGHAREAQDHLARCPAGAERSNACRTAI
jgi:hypothetical protein